jgi:hypothetical protein
MIVLLNHLKIVGINVKFIRCDNSGDDKALQNECKSKGLSITYEFSGRRSDTLNYEGYKG